MSFRVRSINVLVTALAVGCAIRAPQVHSFVLEINGPTAGAFEGSYTAGTRKTAHNAKEVRFQSADFAKRPIVIRARARTFAYQVANNGDEALKIKLVVDGKDNGTYNLVPPGQFWAGRYDPGDSSLPGSDDKR